METLNIINIGAPTNKKKNPKKDVEGRKTRKGRVLLAVLLV